MTEPVESHGAGLALPKLAIAPLTEAQIALARAELSALPQVEPVTDHYFVPQPDGTFLYCRKVSRPANIATLGRVHKQEHFYVVAAGMVALRSEHGTTIHRAGDVIVSKPGTQRLVVSMGDSVTITMHRVSSMDMEQIERELCEDDEASNYGPGNKVKPAVLTQDVFEGIAS
jgi:mannose-6-phosphate isomerase-like protein (cupin superfamily)